VADHILFTLELLSIFVVVIVGSYGREIAPTSSDLPLLLLYTQSGQR
jgi:UTP:GlnB (protein PII) uridylyltransferase